MKLRNMRLESNPKLMIIPMIDIIFFLLVFFMISTLYMVEQWTLPVNLPMAANSQFDMQNQLVVTLTEDGRLFIDQENIPGELFRSRIREELARRPDVAIILRADQRTEYGKVIAVLDEMKGLGVHRIAVATKAFAR